MRVTVDKDYVSEFERLKTYFNLRHICRGRVTSINISADDDGVHLIGYGLPISFEQSLELRRLLGDDPARIGFDESRISKPKQVLWTKKNKNRVRFMTKNDVLRLPFWSKVPREVYARKNPI